MTDRELLEKAAKAAGVHANQWADPGELLEDKGGWVQFIGYGRVSIWNPLTDDGDALRLAVKLRLSIDVDFQATHAYADGKGAVCQHNDDPHAATRRAIVRTAAAIGEQS